GKKMKQFLRVIPYITFQWKKVVVSVLCAFGAVVFMVFSFAAAMPLLKVMINEEGPDGWLSRELVKKRTGISFNELPLDIRTGDEGSPLPPPVLQVTGLDKKAPEANKQLAPLDVVDSVRVLEGEELLIRGRHEMLRTLMQAPMNTQAEITVHDFLQQTRTVTIILKNLPFYLKPGEVLAERFYQQRQAAQGDIAAFKQASIVLIVKILIVGTFFCCLFRFIHEYLVGRISYKAVQTLRLDMYKHTLRLPLSYFSQDGVSDSTSRFVQDATLVFGGMRTILGQLVSEPIALVGLLAFVLFIDVKITIFILLAVPPAGILINQLGRRMKKAARRSLESWVRVVGQLQGSLLGIRVVKAYHQETGEDGRMERINSKLLRQFYRMAKIDAATGPLVESVGAVTGGIGLLLATKWLVDGTISASDFFAMGLAFAAMAQSVRKLAKVFTVLQTANAAAERVYNLIDTVAEKDVPGAVELNPLREALTFEGISFTYPGSPVKTLDDINLTVRAGETIAVVGPNGSGKTTLTSLIPRFFLPDAGVIRIDGIDIAHATLASLRGQIGIVTQQSVVFHDTVAANIAYGRPEATRQDVIDAARRAYAHEFIEATENGYETLIGEQGATLSGGQLQRLAIARAILCDPAILIFDEATSQIDADSEAKIHQALTDFARQRTAFIIAHRLSTIINADRIVVMDAGRIVAAGKHADLLKTCHLYRQLYEMQFHGEKKMATETVSS
ncbi:MAG: ABC transporter ATP-binding protein, partial [Sedimentisphaerales bacterium]|nr:ABC transporter ATP-binding protein [Sedimentisphaerales bacterium]